MANLKIKKIKAYFVGGVSGVGKTTILNELKKLNQQFQIIHGSEYFMKWLGLKKGDYESLRSLPDNFKNKELDKMIRYLVYHPPESSKTLLISGHFIKTHKGEITNAIGDWISLFDGLIFIYFPPKEILRRINNNTERDRQLFPDGINEKRKLYYLNLYTQKSIKKVKELSRRYKIPYFIINNQDKKIQNTVKDLMNWIKKSNGLGEEN